MPWEKRPDPAADVRVAADRSPSDGRRWRGSTRDYGKCNAIGMQRQPSPPRGPAAETPRQITSATLKVGESAVNSALGLHAEPLRDDLTLGEQLDVRRPLAMRCPPIPPQDQATLLQAAQRTGAGGALRGPPVRIASTSLPTDAPGSECGFGLHCAIQFDPQGNHLDGPQDSLLQRTQAHDAVGSPVQFPVLFRVTL
jgi:hypothetical protein